MLFASSISEFKNSSSLSSVSSVSEESDSNCRDSYYSSPFLILCFASIREFLPSYPINPLSSSYGFSKEVVFLLSDIY